MKCLAFVAPWVGASLKTPVNLNGKGVEGRFDKLLTVIDS